MKIKKILIVFFATISLLILTNINVAAKDIDTPSSNGYVIKNYDVEIDVQENNSFLIYEKITVDFTEYKQGIIRTIPMRNNIIRTDGTYSKNRARLTGLNVENENYNFYASNGLYIVKIGREGHKIKGEHTYILKYKYSIGNDPLKNKDEFYFNIIGDRWDTTIENVNFKITMPKPFVTTTGFNLGFSSGPKGTNIINPGSVFNYSVDGQVITGTHDMLNLENALTIRMELPNNYFNTQGIMNIDIITFITIVLSIIFLLISIAQHFIGKSKKNIAVQFFPPSGYNSLEIAQLYKIYASSKDVSSLLVFLANKGYLSIAGDDMEYTITKIKDYDGKNKYEGFFFKNLFRYKDAVTDTDLYNRFYNTTNKIRTKINEKANIDKLVKSKNHFRRIIIALFMTVIFLLITVYPAILYNPDIIVVIAVPMTLYAMIVFVLLFLKSPLQALMISLLVIFVSFFTLNMFLGDILRINPIYYFTFIFGFISIFIMMIMLSLVKPIRSEFGKDILAQIEGFKMFLSVAEKKKLEMLVDDNPEYFYDILPFTYVLGISDTWIKQFESMNLKAPDWYSGSDNFSAASFSLFVTSIMNSSTHSPGGSSGSDSSSSGGSSSSSGGGGSSGGGSGGGGGSSW